MEGGGGRRQRPVFCVNKLNKKCARSARACSEDKPILTYITCVKRVFGTTKIQGNFYGIHFYDLSNNISMCVSYGIVGTCTY